MEEQKTYTSWGEIFNAAKRYYKNTICYSKYDTYLSNDCTCRFKLKFPHRVNRIFIEQTQIRVYIVSECKKPEHNRKDEFYDKQGFVCLSLFDIIKFNFNIDVADTMAYRVSLLKRSK